MLIDKVEVAMIKWQSGQGQKGEEPGEPAAIGEDPAKSVKGERK